MKRGQETHHKHGKEEKQKEEPHGHHHRHQEQDAHPKVYTTIQIELPSFDDLKKHEPPLSSWKLWPAGDQKGTLNLLTPERICHASKLVKKGRVFALNWDLKHPSPSLIKREGLKHTIMDYENCHDDIIELNTQASSQWDGFRHFSSKEHKCYYNGVQPNQVSESTDINGIQVWAKSGIVGRGVLIDYYQWSKDNNRKLDLSKRIEITVDEIKQIAKSQDVSFHIGDIFIIRTGWTKWYSALSPKEKIDLSKVGPLDLQVIGVKQEEESLRFLWDNHFAAIVSDSFAFEAYPPLEDPKAPIPFMHDVFLPLFGLPIGEMFDLDDLAEDCHKDRVYEFFFTSAPLNIPGGVASPPNALAIK